jgi:mycothione reductase
MTAVPHHDVVIIGSGSGNAVIDDSFSHLSVAIIDQRRTGGTCLNYGCIPSKMLIFAADVRDAVATAGRYQVDVQPDVDCTRLLWPALRDRVFGVTDAHSDEGRHGRERSDYVTYYAGHAEFTGPRRLRVRTEDGAEHDITADKVVLANGGRPVIPDVVADSGLPYETSDTIMRIDAPPRRLAVLGGGYIAAELAHVLSAAGSEITIVSTSEELLGAPQDGDIRATFTELMAKRHDVRLGVELTELTGEPGRLVLHLDDGGTVAADMLLVATGRTSNADRLNVAAAGIDTHDSGRIRVDEFCRTTADGVFALGDVSTAVPLKHVANRESAVVAHNLRHPDRMRTVDLSTVPSAVFTNPQMASVGLTEE